MPHPHAAKTPRASRWSPERRAKHAAAIRRWKPWAKSTGPRTHAGKAKSAQNACKHGVFTLKCRLGRQALAAQGRCLRLIALYSRLWFENPQNELLAGLHARIRALDRLFLIRLEQSFRRGELCKNLAFSPPLRQIVNANSSIGPTGRERGGADGDGALNERHKTQFHGFRKTRERNPRGGGHVGRGGFIRHGGAFA